MTKKIPLLQDSAGFWTAYALVLVVLAAVCFGRLADHPFDVDDELYLQDCAAVSADFFRLFSAEKLFPGRPLVEFVLWGGYVFWGEDAGKFHLLVVFLHVLASFFLAVLGRRLGGSLEAIFLGGALFLINVAHFRAVYWISAVAYPLALLFVLAGLLCHEFYVETGKKPFLAGLYAALLAGVLAHASAAFAWFVCIFIWWRKGRDKRHFRWLLPLGLLLAVEAAGLAYLFPQVSQIRQMGLPVIGEGLQLALWFWSRLVTTAHWLPVVLHGLKLWELAVGFLALLAFLFVVRSRSLALSVWGVWTLVMVLPFLVHPLSFFKEAGSDPSTVSRYIYLGSAGSSMLAAWALHRFCTRIGGNRTLPFDKIGMLASILVLTASSVAAFEKVESLSFYTAGRNHYFKQTSTKLGIDLLKRAVDGDGAVVPLADAYYFLGNFLLQEGEDVASVVAEGLHLFPDERLLLLQNGVVQATARDEEVRKRGVDQVDLLVQGEDGRRIDIELQQMAANIYARAAKGYVRKGAYERCILALRQALRYAPQRVSLVHFLATILENTGRHKEAIAAFERCVELEKDPAKNFTNYMRLAVNRHEQGDLSGAVDAMENSLRIDSGSADVHFGLGNLRYQNGQRELAVAAYREAIRIRPDSRVYTQLAAALEELGETEEAEEMRRKGAEGVR
ncbi:MAG: tetratricopeptide repeat protein [Gemmatimonadetes bacterium]|jgi:tetratricopeptide (TPR) repeat protein|nr:tetratricopeptide repeat protein [Gemmatimonadota bacterium]